MSRFECMSSTQTLRLYGVFLHDRSDPCVERKITIPATLSSMDSAPRISDALHWSTLLQYGTESQAPTEGGRLKTLYKDTFRFLYALFYAKIVEDHHGHLPSARGLHNGM